MPTLVELASQIVASQASTTALTVDDILSALDKVHAKLIQLESGVSTSPAVQEAEAKPTLSIKDAFKKNEVVCMVCGKGGFTTLGRHLSAAHGLKPREYKKQFGIPGKQSLSAKSYSDSRRKTALELGLAGNLAKARQTRMEKVEAKKNPPAKVGKEATPKAPAKATKTAAAKTPKAPKTAKPAKPAKPAKAAKPANK